MCKCLESNYTVERMPEKMIKIQTIQTIHKNLTYTSHELSITLSLSLSISVSLFHSPPHILLHRVRLRVTHSIHHSFHSIQSFKKDFFFPFFSFFFFSLTACLLYSNEKDREQSLQTCISTFTKDKKKERKRGNITF